MSGHIKREEGQTLSEYAVMLGIIVPVIIIAIALLADRIAARIGGVPFPFL